MNSSDLVFLIPIVGIICGTGMVSAIAVSVAIVTSRGRKKEDLRFREGVLARLEAIEARVTDQEQTIGKLEDDNRFLNRLLTNRAGADSTGGAGGTA